ILAADAEDAAALRGLRRRDAGPRDLGDGDAGRGNAELQEIAPCEAVSGIVVIVHVGHLVWASPLPLPRAAGTRHGITVSGESCRRYGSSSRTATVMSGRASGETVSP